MSEESVREKIGKAVERQLRLRLTQGELLDAFGYAPEHPLWRGVVALVGSFRESCVLVSTDPDLSEREATMALGGVAVMDDWLAELQKRATAGVARREQIASKEAEKEASGTEG